MTLREAAEQALEALEAHADFGIKADRAIDALRAALAEPDEVAAEREACARVLDEEKNDKWIGDDAWEMAARCAALIRARGNDESK